METIKNKNPLTGTFRFVGVGGILRALTRSLGATHRKLRLLAFYSRPSISLGGCGGNRTLDRWLKRPLLYRLSYAPECL